jgi:hypothetical protein
MGLFYNDTAASAHNVWWLLHFIVFLVTWVNEMVIVTRNTENAFALLWFL